MVLLAASILLHLIAFSWADGHLRIPTLHEPQPTVITTALLAAAPPVKPAAAEPPARPAQPKRRPRPQPPRPAAQPEAAVTALSEPSRSEPYVEPHPVAEPPVSDTASAPESVPDESASAAPPAAVNSAADQQRTASYKVDPPPPAELEYDVQALVKGLTYHGTGKIGWQAAGGSYTVTGKAKVAFFTVLDFRSEGAIDASGIAPVLYTEKSRSKAETNTHFHRERNLISFSASTTSYPRQGGEQDRASIVWQLAAIGRADREKFAPGAELEIFVAGVRDGEMWRIRVIGEEEIETGGEKKTAWHVMRMPRAGSYERKLDIWLAPQQEWYPVKLRFTETNGDYLDMSLSNVVQAAPR